MIRVNGSIMKKLKYKLIIFLLSFAFGIVTYSIIKCYETPYDVSFYALTDNYNFYWGKKLRLYITINNNESWGSFYIPSGGAKDGLPIFVEFKESFKNSPEVIKFMEKLKRSNKPIAIKVEGRLAVSSGCWVSRFFITHIDQEKN
jgi:hypothetical protein